MVDHKFQYGSEREIPVPAKVGRFQIERRANQGDNDSYAAIYRAIDPISSHVVAIKVFGNQYDSYEQSLNAALTGALDTNELLREAELLSRIPHPNIISILDIGEDPEMGPFYVMEWMHGGDLKSLLTKSPNRAIDLGKAISIVQDILAALEAAHSSGIIHRDVKPSNILFDSTGRAKLADFGIATAISADNIEAARGTPGYMAPEQFGNTSNRQSGPATDIYSIGIVFLEMLSGKIHENPDTSRITHIGIPPTIEQVINRAISKDPIERFQTADDMARSLTLIV